MGNARRLSARVRAVLFAEPERAPRDADLEPYPGPGFPGLVDGDPGEAEDLAGEEQPKAAALP
jgi:hypothetical protein